MNEVSLTATEIMLPMMIGACLAFLVYGIVMLILAVGGSDTWHRFIRRIKRKRFVVTIRRVRSENE